MALTEGETIATRAESIDYATKRGWSDWLGLSGDAQDAALRDGSDYIVSVTTWPGTVASSTQIGPFPRVGWTDRERRPITGTPDQAKAANIEAARLSLAGPLVGGAQSPALIRKKVGQIEREFAAPKSAAQVAADRLANVHALIRSIGGKISGGSTVAISKS